MKHSVCGGWIEIRTDPKNTAYVVTEGAKQRDNGEDKIREGDMVIMTEEERERLQNDAFAALEGKVEDKRQQTSDKSRIEEIYRDKEKIWDDPYAASKKVRKTFRAERKLRQQNEALTEELKDRMSLGIDLLQETEEDQKRASFVDFGVTDADSAISRAQAQPLFGKHLTVEGQARGESKRSKAGATPEDQKVKFRQQLGANTRAAMDPFLTVDRPPSKVLPQVRRKQELSSSVKSISAEAATKPTQKAVPLVEYDSD